MAYEIEYQFEELPLLTVNGIQAGLVSGTAIVDVLAGGEWTVSELWLDGYRDGKNVLAPATNLPGTSEGALYLMLLRELTDGRFKDSIQDRVDEWREDNRAHRRVA